MTWKDLEVAVPGRVSGSSVEVLAVRGDAETSQVEIAEIHDNSLALGATPANSVHRVVRISAFRPWPRRVIHLGGQPFAYEWAGGSSKCAQCSRHLEHFAYVGVSGGDVREREQGAIQPIWYCESCAHNPL